jgi:hypothetical protein
MRFVQLSTVVSSEQARKPSDHYVTGRAEGQDTWCSLAPKNYIEGESETSGLIG